MNFFYILPFSYFYNTRLRGGSVGFHLIFEWIAAVVLVVTVGAGGEAGALAVAGFSYLAFISLYEIGYMVNDLVAAKWEDGGRKRGPQQASQYWVALWCCCRIAVFFAFTIFLGFLTAPEWWFFFLALCIVFALHNVLQDKELKSATFIWLAWLRFMAPVMFVLDDSQRMGVGFAAGMTYVGFRSLGYLDSKGLLSMAGRQRPEFRLFYFLIPLAGALVLWPYESALGFVILTGYYAVAATFGTLVTSLSSRSASK